jgi:hypothetical protein
MATWSEKTFKYAGSVALKGGEAMAWSAKDTVAVATVNTDKPVGFAAHACTAGNVVTQNLGVYMLNKNETLECIASTAITAGAYITATTAGEMVTTTPKATYEASAVEWIWGVANEAAAAQGDVISIICMPTSQSQ